MKLKAIAAEYPPKSKLMVAVAILLISMLIFSLINVGIAWVFYGVTILELPALLSDLTNPRAVELAKVMQSFSSIGFFIVPSLLLALLFGNRALQYLRMTKKVDIYTALIVVAAVITSIPLINYLGELNSRLLLPGFMSEVYDWMKSYEVKAEQLTEAFLKMSDPSDLAANILLIGLLPALGEELLFRGIVQRILGEWTKNKHWAVWITAFIFSTVHLQFFGFVPRLLLGALLGYLFVWSGSLWLPIIAHFVNNATAVVLTYLYGNGLLPFNPVNMGADDGSLMPVFVSVVIVAMLLLLINQREKRNRWLNRTVEQHDGELIDYEKVLIEFFEKQEAKPGPVAAAPAAQPLNGTAVHEEVAAATAAAARTAPAVQAVTETPAAPAPSVVGIKRKPEVAYESSPMTAELTNFEITDFSDQAQHEMITRMDLPFKLGAAAYFSFLNQYGFIKLDEEGSFARPTGLGLLMLGKSPQLHFPQARIKFTIHRDKENPVIKDFEGPLVLMPGKIEEYLDVIVSTSINRDQFHRVSLSEIPKKVLREVIINAIVHRDYSIEGARIMVDAYTDRVEVSSPGIPKYPIKKFYECNVPSVSRNQKISYIFNQMHLVEERGLGMKELKTLKEEGNPPDFKLDSDIFTTILYRSKTHTPAIPEESPNLTEAAVKEYIRQKHKISAGDYSKRFNVTTKTAQRHLNKLIEDGVVEKEGDKKGTKYFLKEE